MYIALQGCAYVHDRVNMFYIVTCRYRNSYKHNLSLDMLQDGFHKSFSEMFALIKQENSERLAAGPESILWSRTLLEDQPEKLDTLKKLLTEAEMAQRRGEHTIISLK